MLEVADLACTPRDGAPLRGVSLTVAPREIVAVVGPNGGGKQTLCRCLARLAEPTAGTIHFAGAPLPARTEQVVQRGLVVMMMGRRVFPDMTVADNLRATGWPLLRRRRTGSHRLIAELFPFLSSQSAQAAGTLSGGEQQMLALARALLLEPSMLILDGPSVGLSPRMAGAVYAELRRFASGGGAVLTTEDHLGSARGYAHRAYLVVRGRVVASGPADTVAQHPEALESLLDRDAAAPTLPHREESDRNGH